MSESCPSPAERLGTHVVNFKIAQSETAFVIYVPIERSGMNTDFPWLRIALLVTALTGSTAAAVINVNPTADAFITASSADPNAGLPSANYGGAGALMVSGSGTTKGEMQSLLKFNLASAKVSFDTMYGAGNWIVDGITLQLGTNFGTSGAQPNNPIFDTISGGLFKVDWLANDNWGEGSGNPGAPFFPANAPVDGITFGSLGLLLSGADQTLGTFTYTPVGNTNPPGVSPAGFALGLSAGFFADIAAGNDVSLRAYPGDASVGYLFNARSFGTAVNRPVLVVSAVPEPATGGFLAGTAFLWLARRRRHAPGA
jgi:hypothetical protein